MALVIASVVCSVHEDHKWISCVLINRCLKIALMWCVYWTINKRGKTPSSSVHQNTNEGKTMPEPTDHKRAAALELIHADMTCRTHALHRATQSRGHKGSHSFQVCFLFSVAPTASSRSLHLDLCAIISLRRSPNTNSPAWLRMGLNLSLNR